MTDTLALLTFRVCQMLVGRVHELEIIGYGLPTLSLSLSLPLPPSLSAIYVEFTHVES